MEVEAELCADGTPFDINAELIDGEKVLDFLAKIWYNKTIENDENKQNTAYMAIAWKEDYYDY